MSNQDSVPLGQVQHLGSIPLDREVQPLYFSAEAFGNALLALPAEWKKLQYLHIRFTEHQRVLVANHAGFEPLYYIKGEWIEWKIPEEQTQNSSIIRVGATRRRR